MNYKWIFEQSTDNNKVLEIAKQLNNMPLSLARILVNRGINTFDKAKIFFRPSLEYLYDPFLLNDMDRAVNRVLDAVENGEKIMVYGDYDVDGTTSVALMYSFLKNNLTENLTTYIPDRYTEGYGISYKGIDTAKTQNCSLIIALDCGIKAVKKVEYAKEQGIDFIICDHHTPGDKLPDAVAVLNPKRQDSTYPFKELTGCGVGFKLAQAISLKRGFSDEKFLDLIDYVAVSIAADLVPIVDENRVIVYFGLKKILEDPRPGLKALMKVANLIAEGEKPEIFTVSDVVFKIAPRINAAGRMEHAETALKLLVESNEKKAEYYAEKINSLNLLRQKEQQQIFEQAISIIKQDSKTSEKYANFVYADNWNKGVIGIVASKIIENYYKPTIILTKSGDYWTGSGRSVRDFDLYTAIDDCRHLLTNFGGHKYAAGLSLSDDNLAEFAECFESSVKRSIQDISLQPVIKITGEIKFAEITPKFIRLLRQFAPFGPGNMRPVFVTRKVRDTGMSRQIGKDYKHLSLELTDGNHFFSAIAFGFGHLYDKIKNGKTFDIAYTITEQMYKGRHYIKLNIKDIKV